MATLTQDLSIKFDIEALLGLRSLGYQSTLLQALKESRFTSARNPETGEIIKGRQWGFLGILGYLCLVDQIGAIFRPANSSRTVNPNLNEFRKALKYFTNLVDDDIDALYALRCSYAHNFSMININIMRGKFISAHAFRLQSGTGQNLVTQAARAWDGKLVNYNIPDDCITYVNPEEVGALVEKLVDTLVTLHKSSNLLCNLDGSELISRYTFILQTKTP